MTQRILPVSTSASPSSRQRAFTGRASRLIGRRQWLMRMAGVTVVSLSGRRAHAARWPSEHRAGCMWYHADFDLNLSPTIVDETQRLHRTVPTTLGLDPSGELIKLFLFEERDTYRRYLHQYFPSVPYRRALFIKERGPGMVFAYRSGEFGIDLRHETTHAILHTMLPLVPLWLDEGLAEYFEVQADQRYAASPHLKGVQRRLRWRRPPSLAELERMDDLSEMGSEQYRDAWAWVHLLLHGPVPLRTEFQQYLMDIHSHMPPGLLSRRLTRRVPALEDEFTDHFSRLDIRIAGSSAK